MRAFCAQCNKPLEVKPIEDGVTCGCPDHPDAMVTFIEEQTVQDPPLQFISPEGQILSALQFIAKYGPKPIQPDPSMLSDSAHIMLLPQVMVATQKFIRSINVLLVGGAP